MMRIHVSKTFIGLVAGLSLYCGNPNDIPSADPGLADRGLPTTPDSNVETGSETSASNPYDALTEYFLEGTVMAERYVPAADCRQSEYTFSLFTTNNVEKVLMPYYTGDGRSMADALDTYLNVGDKVRIRSGEVLVLSKNPNPFDVSDILWFYPGQVQKIQ